MRACRCRQQGIPETRLGGTFGFLRAGNGVENVNHGESETLLGKIDVQPANRVFRRSRGAAFAAHRGPRDHADAVVNARRTAGNDVRPAIRGEGLAECHAGPGAVFGEGDEIGIVIGDGADDADVTRTAAVLNVPGKKFHAPLVGRSRNYSTVLRLTQSSDILIAPCCTPHLSYADFFWPRCSLCARRRRRRTAGRRGKSGDHSCRQTPGVVVVPDGTMQ